MTTSTTLDPELAPSGSTPSYAGRKRSGSSGRLDVRSTIHTARL